MTLPAYSAVCVCIFSFPAACRKVTRLRGHAQAVALRLRPFVVCGLVTAPARVPSPHPREPRRFGSQGRPLPIAQGPGRTAFHARCRPPPRRSPSPPPIAAPRPRRSRLPAQGPWVRVPPTAGPKPPPPSPWTRAPAGHAAFYSSFSGAGPGERVSPFRSTCVKRKALDLHRLAGLIVVVRPETSLCFVNT